jgi:hypothetical protein
MISWSIFARDAETEKQWVQQIRQFQKLAGTALGDRVQGSGGEIGEIWLIDSQRKGWQDWLETQDRKGRSYILVVEEGAFLPDGRSLELTDDLLSAPFRMVDLLSSCRSHFVKLEVDVAQSEMDRANEVLERILLAKSPKRFQAMKGLNVSSKHLTGLKPGGDYFDLFESESRDYVNILLADSSSYGLSSVLLGMVLSNSAKIANESQLRSSDWIQTIYSDLKTALGQKESLSLFFGRLNRRDFTLHYQLYGSIEAFRISREGECEGFAKQGGKITADRPPVHHEESVIVLNPRDRLVLLSDGFVEGVGGDQYLKRIFHNQIDRDPALLVNELSFRIKSKLVDGETFPGEDCSAIVIDIQNRVLRLAPTG